MTIDIIMFPLSSWGASCNAIFNTGEYNFNTATHLLLPTALTNYYPPLSRFARRLAASFPCPSSRRWWTTASYVLSPVKEILLSRSSFSRASESSSVNGVPANTTSNVDTADKWIHTGTFVDYWLVIIIMILTSAITLEDHQIQNERYKEI